MTEFKASDGITVCENKFLNRGYIYCVSHPLYDSVYKIGCTKKTPECIVKGFKLEFSRCVSDCYAAERGIHHILSKYRIRPDKKFFKHSRDGIKAVFDALCEE